jgi:3-phenylpropionate/trans-cinnamate dioxygenase ferredoxin reductase component
MPDRRYDYLILGAGVAGTAAAETLREANRVADIGVVTDESHYLYYRPRLPGYVGGHVGLEQIVERDAAWARRQRLDVLLNTTVTALDPAAHLVTLADGRTLGYGRLLVATGARPRRLNVPGEDLAGVHSLWSLDDADRIRAELAGVRRAVVIGGGFIAAELLEAFRLRGLDVSYVVRGPRWFYPFTDEAAGVMVARELREAGIDARFDTRVVELTGADGRVTGVRTEAGDWIAAGLVTRSLGARWEMGWFERAGGRVGRGALTDEWLRTDLPDVWAAGDAADPVNPHTGRRIKTFNVYTAGVQGRMAALGMLDRPKQLLRLPWYGFRVLGLFFTFIGMVDVRDPTLESWTVADEAERGYTRVFIRDRRVVGGLLVNSTLAQPVRRYAESGEPLPADPGLVLRGRS